MFFGEKNGLGGKNRNFVVLKILLLGKNYENGGVSVA